MSEDEKWRPEGGEVVASSHLIEIDELTGGRAALDLVTEEERSELNAFIFVLSGKIAVTGCLEDEDARTLATLLADSTPIEATVEITDASCARSNGQDGR